MSGEGSGEGSGERSAEGVLAQAVAQVLRQAAGLAALNGVYAGPPLKASPPWAEIGETLGIDWGTKDRAGRELRIAVTIRDAGETSARTTALAAAAGAAIEALPRGLAGWNVASVVLARSRLAGSAAGRWSVTLDYRVRMLAA